MIFLSTRAKFNLKLLKLNLKLLKFNLPLLELLTLLTSNRYIFNLPLGDLTMPKHLIAANRARAQSEQRQEKRALRLTLYARRGKRCSSCWHFKPPAMFGMCTSTADQLFAECRPCVNLRNAIRKAGALADWYRARDALRATAPAVALAPDDGRPAVGRRDLRQYRYRK